MTKNLSPRELMAENAELRQQLDEAKETLRAITSGEVDALIVNTSLGERAFTLQGADTVYRTAIENINEGAITLSPEGIILYSNKYFAQILRTDLNKVIGASIFDFIGPENRGPVAAMLSQDSGRSEVSLYALDGTIVLTYLATKKLQMESLTICGIITDLTEQKRHKIAQAINRIFEKFLKAENKQELGELCLAEAIGITGSKIGFIGETNERLLEEITASNPGWEACKTLNTHSFNILPGQFKIHGLFGRVMTGGKSLIANKPASHPDSIGIPEGHPPLLSFLATPLISDQTIGIIAVANREGGYTYEQQEELEALAPAIVEVFQRQKAEQALKETEAMASALIKYAPTAIYELDFRGQRFLSVNDAMSVVTGYTREELFAIGPSALLDDDSRKVFADRIKRQFAGEKVGESVEYGVKKKDGSIIYASLNVAFSKTRPNTALVIAHDVTERKKAEEELEQRSHELEEANTELEAFSYSVSHDLRAPLRIMEGFSKALIEDYPDKLDEQGKKWLEYIRSSSLQMGQLINDLLDLSRIIRAEFNKDKVSLSQLAKVAARKLQSEEPNRQVTLRIAEGISCNCDINLLRIAIENLMSNAFKFTSKNQSALIEFGATDKDGKIVYFMRDNGAGFDMTQADKLFQPFQRLHRDQDFPGNGIGLATVQRIIRRHSGKVWAEGEVGKGATFYFTLN
jgi:PAS domain S-box-containing protein